MAIKRAVVMPQAWLVGLCTPCAPRRAAECPPYLRQPHRKSTGFRWGHRFSPELSSAWRGRARKRDRWWIRAAAGKVWPGLPVYATDDLETALAAAGEQDGREAAASGLDPQRHRVVLFWAAAAKGWNRRRKLSAWGDGPPPSATGGAATTLDSMALRAVAGGLDRNGKMAGPGRNLFCGSCS